MLQIKGIDVSKWQGEIDWNEVKSDGVEFVFIRTGYSNNYTDPYFEEYYSYAKTAGIKVGAYHYSYAQSADDAKSEAEFALTLLKNKEFDYPIAFDVEENSQIKLGKKIITDMIISFCDTIKSAGYTPMLYTNTNWRSNYIDMTRIPYLLWQAHYTSPKPPAIDNRVSVWQYSSTGKVDGVNGNVDMNTGFVDLTIPDNNSDDYEELKKLIDDWTGNSRIKYNYIDNTMPEWARATITKLVTKGYLTGDDTGDLRLSDDMLRIFVVLDRAGAFGQ